MHQQALRAILSAVYSTYVERSPDGKPAGREHLHLPADAEKDSSGFGWRLSNGNMLETEARLAGLFNGLEAELDLARTGMKVARALNSDAKGRANKHGVPLLASPTSSAPPSSPTTAGQNYHGVTFQFIGAVGEPEGPSEEEVLRASALCDVVETSIAASKREATLMVEDRNRIGITPPNPRPLITSCRWAAPTPPPVRIRRAGRRTVGFHPLLEPGLSEKKARRLTRPAGQREFDKGTRKTIRPTPSRRRSKCLARPVLPTIRATGKKRPIHAPLRRIPRCACSRTLSTSRAHRAIRN